MVRPEGVEPPTYWFVASCSIQLSYGRTLRGCNNHRIPKMGCEGNRAIVSPTKKEGDGAPGRIRTSDPLVRSQMLYPAELRARGMRLLWGVYCRECQDAQRVTTKSKAGPADDTKHRMTL